MPPKEKVTRSHATEESCPRVHRSRSYGAKQQRRNTFRCPSSSICANRYKQKPTVKARKPVEPREACEGAHWKGTRWESQWGQGVWEVGRPGWNETNGTENVSANWTRLFLVATNFNKVPFFQPRDMEATASRKRLPGCYDLGVHINFSLFRHIMVSECSSAPTLFKCLSKVMARLRRWPVPFFSFRFGQTIRWNIFCSDAFVHYLVPAQLNTLEVQLTIAVGLDWWSKMTHSFVLLSPPLSKPLYNLHSSQADLQLIKHIPYFLDMCFFSSIIYRDAECSNI